MGYFYLLVGCFFFLVGCFYFQMSCFFFILGIFFFSSGVFLFSDGMFLKFIGGMFFCGLEHSFFSARITGMFLLSVFTMVIYYIPAAPVQYP